jgi:hypothetical protein
MAGWDSIWATLAVGAALTVSVMGAGLALAQEPGDPAVPAVNPCLDPAFTDLLCPDLQMAPPSEMYVTRKGGKVLLHATNNIKSRGRGPMELRGRREDESYMDVRQAIHTAGGGVRTFATNGHLIFYFIPGQGHYWKFQNAAQFELWSINPDGTRGSLVKVGAKLNYCLRDLKRTRPSARSPKKQVYPACSQDPKKKRRTLGTSVGWSDIYPSTYYQNWINVSGLSGCFEFVHRADPLNHLFELKEGNNEGSVRVQLPPKGRRVSGC